MPEAAFTAPCQEARADCRMPIDSNIGESLQGVELEK